MEKKALQIICSLPLITIGIGVLAGLCSLLFIGLVQASLRELSSNCFKVLNAKLNPLSNLSVTRFSKIDKIKFLRSLQAQEQNT
jgi:hypothetical protein